MKKIVKKWGATYVVVLGKEEVEILGVKEGDIIEFAEIKVEKKEVKK